MKTSISFVFIFLFLISNAAEAAGVCVGAFRVSSNEVWGSRFLKNYEPFDFSQNPMTVGIEIEGVVPKSVGREGLVKKVG